MRSILKHPHLSDHQCPQPFPFATSATVEVSPHVHFPPTPTLTSIFITHSSSVYDRTPAEVPPNACALPGRHEREFVDTPYPRSRRVWDTDTEGPQGNYFQPRGYGGHWTELSDESDGVLTPPEPAMPVHSIAVRLGDRNAHDAMSYPPNQDAIESTLLFLPHPPSASPKVKKGTRRSHSVGWAHPKEPRRETADGRIQRHNDFAIPTLDFDGCLGGF